MIRTFIAVKLPDIVRRLLEEQALAFEKLLPDGTVRWVKPELMHLTLRFLGDTADDRLPAIYDALDRVGTETAPFTLRLEKSGAFPIPRRPRVLWAGLQDDAGQAAALKQRLDAALTPLGWEPEARPFTSHITLGRTKGDQRTVATLPLGMALPPAEAPVTAIHLIESKLRPAGPVYSTLHTARLLG